jgi:hypothetical protein
MKNLITMLFAGYVAVAMSGGFCRGQYGQRQHDEKRRDEEGRHGERRHDEKGQHGERGHDDEERRAEKIMHSLAKSGAAAGKPAVPGTTIFV